MARVPSYGEDEEDITPEFETKCPFCSAVCIGNVKDSVYRLRARESALEAGPGVCLFCGAEASQEGRLGDYRFLKDIPYFRRLI
jgi:hypothetical protein